MTCHECKKDFPITPLGNGWVKVENYCLSKAGNEIQICLECWDSTDKEKYKQEFEEIYFHRGKSKANTIFEHEKEHIQAKCEEESCGKKFDCQTVEAIRHKWNEKTYYYNWKGGFYPLSSKDHEELNKNPVPFKTTEDLVQWWMKDKGYQKIFHRDNNNFLNMDFYFKAIKKDGKEIDVDNDGWKVEVHKWLKKQPNKEFVNKGGDNPERERERESILAYFTKHKIKSITLQNDKLVIEYNNNLPTETKPIDTSELQLIKSYFQSQGLTSLSLSDLQKQTQQPTNYLPWIIGGGIILVLIVGVVIYFLMRKKKRFN